LRSEAREQSAGPFLQLAPSVLLSASVDELSTRVLYHPRFLAGTSESDRRFLQLHRASLGGDLQVVRGTLVSLRQDLLYGREDFSWQTQLADDPTPGFSRTPLAQSVLLMQSVTAASLRQRLDSRFQLIVSGSWEVYGGADPDARMLVPLTRTAAGSVAAAWTGTRDRLSLAGNVSHGIVSGTYGDVIGGTADWLHAFRHELQLRTSFGVARASGSLQQDVFPSGGLSIGIEPVPHQRRLGWSLSISAAPSIDPQTGTLVERASGIATISLPISSALTLSAAGALARRTSGAAAGMTDWQSTANATWSIGRRLAISAGARGVSQPHSQWAAYVAASAWRRDLF
jgi:hypothetical protein